MQVLHSCLLSEATLQVEFESGCAMRFGLSLDDPGSVECVAARLAADRDDCLADVPCGEGEVSLLR